MTHQPPVPEGNTSPYPLHPEPIPEEVKQRHAAEEAAAREEKQAQEQAEVRERRVRTAALGVGAALAAGAAAVTGLLYGRRRSTKSSAAPAQPARRTRSAARAKPAPAPKTASNAKSAPAASPAKAAAPAKAASPARRKPARGDDKAKRGAADRSRVAANEPYEVSYFARKHGLTAAEARDIIKQAGPDRKAANALAQQRKGK